jgi:hypothetical protein
MSWFRPSSAAVLGALLLSAPVSAAYLIEIDTDGLDDGPVAYNSHFSFGGDTTTASSSVAGTAFGLTGGDSIFGGDGVSFGDTYLYGYDPSVDADNLALAAGQALGGGNLATGIVGGGAGFYNVYATWPTTANVSGGDTSYSAATAGDAFATSIDQNSVGDEWVFLGTIAYTSGGITVTQTAGVNSFVSMRASGVLFERAAAPPRVPEPSTLLLFGAGIAGIWLRRRKS